MLSTDGTADDAYQLGSIQWAKDSTFAVGLRVHADVWRSASAQRQREEATSSKGSGACSESVPQVRGFHALGRRVAARPCGTCRTRSLAEPTTGPAFLSVIAASRPVCVLLNAVDLAPSACRSRPAPSPSAPAKSLKTSTAPRWSAGRPAPPMTSPPPPPTLGQQPDEVHVELVLLDVPLVVAVHLGARQVVQLGVVHPLVDRRPARCRAALLAACALRRSSTCIRMISMRLILSTTSLIALDDLRAAGRCRRRGRRRSTCSVTSRQISNGCVYCRPL